MFKTTLVKPLGNTELLMELSLPFVPVAGMSLWLDATVEDVSSVAWDTTTGEFVVRLALAFEFLLDDYRDAGWKWSLDDEE